MTRVAVVQAGSVLFDTPATLEKLRYLATEAAAQGARLAVFPEAFVGGYPKGIDFGARVGSRSGLSLLRPLWVGSSDLGSPRRFEIWRYIRRYPRELGAG